MQKAKNLLAEKKKDEAKKLLERVVDLFPKTPGATERSPRPEAAG